MLLDFRVAVRSALHRPWFVSWLALLMGLAVGVNGAVFSEVSRVLWADLPYPSADRIVRLWMGEQSEPASLFPREYRHVLAVAGDRFSSVAAYRSGDVAVGSGHSAERISAAFVTPSFFDVMALDPRCTSTSALRRSVSSGIPTVLLRESYAAQGHSQLRCGSEEYLLVDGRAHLIAGSVPDHLAVPDGDARLYVLFEPEELRLSSGDRVTLGGMPVWVLARMRPGTSPGSMAVLLRASAAARGGKTLQVSALRDEMIRPVQQPVALVQVLGIFLLVVTLVNVTQAQLARDAARSFDRKVRAALGASPWMASRIALFESGLVAGAGSAVAVVAYQVTHAVLTRFGPASLLTGFRMESPWPVLGSAVLSVLLFCLLPPVLVALRANRQWSTLQLSGAGSEEQVGVSRNQLWTSRAFLVAQVCVTTAAVATSILLVASTRNLLQTELGFEAADVEVVSVHSAAERATDRIPAFLRVAEASSQIAGYATALASDVPLRSTSTTQVQYRSRPLTVHRAFVTAEYFRVLSIPLYQGRMFHAADTAGSEPVMVVSASFAATMGPENPVGAAVRIGGQLFTTVGVVGDVRARGARKASVPTVYVHFPQAMRGILSEQSMSLRRAELLIDPRGAAQTATSQFLRQLRSPALSDVTFGQPRALAAAVEQNTRSTRRLTLVTVVFASITLALGALAAGVSAYEHLRLRRSELAVRVALGAPPLQVRWLIARGTLNPALLGAAAGVPLGYWSSWLVRAHLFGVEPLSVHASIAAAGTVLLGCFCVAVPAFYQAGRVNPVSALRRS